MTCQERDPGLPIDFGPASNGEYEPLPWTPTVREAVRRARQACDDAARRLTRIQPSQGGLVLRSVPSRVVTCITGRR